MMRGQLQEGAGVRRLCDAHPHKEDLQVMPQGREPRQPLPLWGDWGAEGGAGSPHRIEGVLATQDCGTVDQQRALCAP